MMDRIARHLGKTRSMCAMRNLYGDDGRDVTPYGMTVEDNVARRSSTSWRTAAATGAAGSEISGIQRTPPDPEERAWP
jgi:xanthine dehydrogenase large subunit